jgi:hypothetical protein
MNDGLEADTEAAEAKNDLKVLFQVKNGQKSKYYIK